MNETKPTSQPTVGYGQLRAYERDRLPDSAFAFPRQRKEPLTDASHVRNAVARFDQVEEVTNIDRDLAWANIQTAAEYFGIDLSASDWRKLIPPGLRRRSADQSEQEVKRMTGQPDEL
jgi:hypothetical protein